MADVYTIAIGWSIVFFTWWAFSGRGDRDIGSFRFRIRWLAAAATFVFFSVWSIKVDRVPWPWPPDRWGWDRLWMPLPKLLVGGSASFPAIFWLLQLFLLGMAIFCIWRACQRS